MTKRPPTGAPYAPVPYDLLDVTAMQALYAGTAQPHQQKRIFAWITEQAAGVYDLSYRPGMGGDRDTCFHEGRRFVGNQCLKLLRLNRKSMKDEQNG